MNKKSMINFENVSKVYGDVTALDILSVDIYEGEFITILGSSGSGKTTALKMMNRLIEPSSGKVTFDGEDIMTLDAVALRRKIGYVVQQIGLFPHMTVEENIAVVPKLLSWDKEKILARTKELMTMVKLPYEEYGKRYPRELSGGQQQRIGVARALAADPPVVLFDEPFGAIDAITRAGLQEELVMLHQQLANKTFVFITHDIHEAFHLGSRVMIMDKGKLVQFDEPAAILENPKSDFVKSLLETVKNQDKIWRKLHD